MVKIGNTGADARTSGLLSPVFCKMALIMQLSSASSQQLLSASTQQHVSSCGESPALPDPGMTGLLPCFPLENATHEPHNVTSPIIAPFKAHIIKYYGSHPTLPGNPYHSD